ncbi:nitrite reductase small subunit NirD [Hyphococcus luteus]|uniref:Nitrite reductase (NAD(P)H) small subunit n=1 Tax=Hyphococcus luteus TaxID=2058213 RepID=A0A2S7K2C3_9PROT|nr:nitrite reductase (NAD(P)H) small subunit [Marinicaulis flavus]
MTGNWISLGALDDIPLRGARRVVRGDLAIAVFRTGDDSVRAIEDTCPHRKGPLSQGIVHGDCVTCPLHNWVISLETGVAQGADEGSVRTFRVRVGKSAEVLLCADDLDADVKCRA